MLRQRLACQNRMTYNAIKNLNATLKSKGYMTVMGHVNKSNFMEKVCYGESENKESKG